MVVRSQVMQMRLRMLSTASCGEHRLEDFQESPGVMVSK